MDEEPSSVAAPKVLGIPELLESILLEVPSLDLLRLQRVNETFKATADGSIKIQQKLFFQKPVSDGDDAATWNPLLLRILHRHLPACLIYVSRDPDEAINEYVMNRTAIQPDSSLRLKAPQYIRVQLGGVDNRLLTMPSCSSYKAMLIADSPINLEAWVKFGRPGRIICCAKADTILMLGEIVEACYALSLDHTKRTGIDTMN